MTNESRQDGCAEWCGLPYGDARVPDNAVLWTREPWTTAKNDPAYCTAACLERAQEKPTFVPYAKLPDGLHAPGLLDHVTSRPEWPTTPCHRCGGGPWQTVNAEGDWCVSCWEKRDKPAPLVEVPTCAGPLATHGTPVLRWAVKSKSNFAPTEARHELLCDGCYLERERNIAAATDADACWLADELQPERYAEPPARIGTVPQVVSVGVGIWASRGMR